MTLTNIAILVISLFGFGVGNFLTTTARSEIKAGRPYFHLAERILYFILFVALLYGFIVGEQYPFLIVALVILLISLFFHPLERIIIGFVCATVAILLINGEAVLFVASALLVYGLPVGTLFEEFVEHWYTHRNIKQKSKPGSKKGTGK